VAPATSTASKTNNFYLIFGLAGLSLGLVALIGIIVIFILKKRAKDSQIENERQDSEKHNSCELKHNSFDENLDT